MARDLYCGFCTKVIGSCVDSGLGNNLNLMTKTINKEKREEGFILKVDGKYNGGSPQALTQSVGLTGPETSKPLRLPTAHPNPHASDALYA